MQARESSASTVDGPHHAAAKGVGSGNVGIVFARAGVVDSLHELIAAGRNVVRHARFGAGPALPIVRGLDVPVEFNGGEAWVGADINTGGKACAFHLLKPGIAKGNDVGRRRSRRYAFEVEPDIYSRRQTGLSRMQSGALSKALAQIRVRHP